MSIHPISYNEETQVYRMLDEEGGHEFDVLLTDLKHLTKFDGTETHLAFVIDCLYEGCGSSSTHPIGGGALPQVIQATAANLIMAKGCPCGLVMAQQRSEVNLSHAKLHCSQQDWLGRWQVEANAGPSDEILVNAEQYVVGLGPFAAVPTGYTAVSLLGRSGSGSIDTILTHTYTKHVSGDIIVAEKPNGTD